jgi:phosphoglycolate phosphatase
MNYKAVIFDLDGTLLDTLEDIACSMNAVLSNAGFPTHTVKAYRVFVGRGIANLVQRALPEECRNEIVVQQHVCAMVDEYGRRWADHTRAYPDIPELLRGLTARKVKMAVLSNKMDNFTKEMVKTLLGDWQFEAVLGAQPAMPQKPDPAGAFLISRQCGVRPEECLYLGDSNIDMQTAVTACMQAIGALWGFQTADQLLAAGAQKLIAKPLELLTLLSGC